MSTNIRLKARPRGVESLSFEKLEIHSGPTLTRLTRLIDPFTSIDPIFPSYSVGALVPKLDYLGASINSHWSLATRCAFFPGEISPKWTVSQLAAYIDKKRAKC